MTDGNALTPETPIVVIVADLPDQSADLRYALQAAGWHVRVVERGAADGLSDAEPLSLFLLDLAETAADDAQTARSIRAIAGRCGTAPILALHSSTPSECGPQGSGVDAVLARSEGTEALVQTMERWRPVSLAPTRRIAAMLGAGPIAGMIERLARRLEAAMSSLDRGAVDRAEAHRLAGLCGTLGFGQAHATWLDLSLGDEAVLPDVRRTTRLTLSAIARGL